MDYFQDEFLDSVYWIRQIVAVVFGILWGVIKFKGLLGILVLVYLIIL